jgi:hypothetical protein
MLMALKSNIRAFALSAALCQGTISSLNAQVVTLDEGAFVISQAKQQVGREQFSIRRPPRSGAVTYVASGTVVYETEGRRLSPALSTDSGGSAVAYQVEARSGTETAERLSATIGRGRFSARSQTTRGESAREYVVGDGAFVVDDGIYHQYYFLNLANRNGVVHLVEPKRNAQITMRVQSVGDETIDVGGTKLKARHVTLSSSGEAERHVWVDASNRVLKVTIPSKGIEAVREDPPK